MSSEDQQERIDNYLLGLGSPEERLELAEEISQNSDLKTQLVDTQSAMDAVEFFEDDQLKQRLRAAEARFQSDRVTDGANAPEAKVRPLPPRRNSTSRWLAIAASVLLLLAAGWFIFEYNSPQSPAQLAQANFTPYENIAFDFVRGADDSIEADAFRAYERGNYARAADNLALLPASAQRSFYRGQALLAQGKFAEAEPIFLELSQSTFGLNRHSEYYRAVAQLGLGNVERAEAMLGAIDEQPDHPLRAEAENLLGKL
ncbi:tetratricopeptide repeat protein [Neolewinella antarctica]|uniref:TolA-binding protein n=1 Tax=Neolewinella antarctica TaxID=442734 RepID=A0ABX0XF47_9BACT|nr:hypothetical protein [Neolewinella antarctica]NJC27362.1 TolA-binding protein [Neolewinella antarctica]